MFLPSPGWSLATTNHSQWDEKKSNSRQQSYLEYLNRVPPKIFKSNPFPVSSIYNWNFGQQGSCLVPNLQGIKYNTIILRVGTISLLRPECLQESCCKMMIVGDDIIGYCPGNIFVWVDCVGTNTTECWGTWVWQLCCCRNQTSAESLSLSLLVQIQTI